MSCSNLGEELLVPVYIFCIKYLLLLSNWLFTKGNKSCVNVEPHWSIKFLVDGKNLFGLAN